jgi:hypothetical protein
MLSKPFFGGLSPDKAMVQPIQIHSNMLRFTTGTKDESCYQQAKLTKIDALDVTIFSKAFLSRLSPDMTMNNPVLIQSCKIHPFKSNIAALEWSLETIALARESNTADRSLKGDGVISTILRRMIRGPDTNLRRTVRPWSKSHSRFIHFIENESPGELRAVGKIMVCDAEKLLMLWGKYLRVLITVGPKRRVPAMFDNRVRRVRGSRVRKSRPNRL